MAPSRRREPAVLRKGKRFEAQEKFGWLPRRGELLLFEKRIVDPKGSSGRLDIFVQANRRMIAIGEVKATDWDKIRLARVRPLVLRHARQVWRYIDTHLQEGREVCPGVIYPIAPRSPRKKVLVEETLHARMIQCVWRSAKK